MFDAALQLIELAIGDYAGVRQEYRTRLYSEILDYLANGANLRSKQNASKRAASDAFNLAGDLGYQDGGGTLPLDEETNAWLNARLQSELVNIDNLFQQLKETRGDPEFTTQEAYDVANTRADGYLATLDSIYNEAKTRGAGNIMLTFGGQDGHAPEFPCRECKKLKGQRHRAAWWVKRGYVPFPGNPNFTCGNWACRHFLYTDDGKLFTI